MTPARHAHNMKTIILLFVAISLAYADPSTTSSGATETSNKSEAKTPNSIPSAPAKGHYFTASRAPSYVQLIQKPLYAHHGHHQVAPTMLIIAQPAYLPHNLVYNQGSNVHAQQLLNYFHNNPAAKYQLLYGFQPPQHAQQHQAPQPTHNQPIYYATAPHNHHQQQFQYFSPQHFSNYVQQPAAVPQPHYTQSSPHYAQAPQYTQVPATYTHQALQSLQVQAPSTSSKGQTSTSGQSQFGAHYYSQAPQTFTPQTPIKTAAPIITGLENFTPEQQAQIKEQLSSHFGSVTQINSNSLQANPSGDYTTKFRIEVQPDAATSYAGATEGSNLKPEAREEQPQHQHHFASTAQSAATSGGFTPSAYTFRTPQYTKG